MGSLRGHLLLANGDLFDPNFRQTVVLLAEHGDEGALGVVLNRPASMTVRDAVPVLQDMPLDDDRIFIGGPVQPQVVAVMAEFDRPLAGVEPAFGNVGFLTGDVRPEDLGGIRRARVFGGYSGWGPGQLEQELAVSAWIVEPASAEDAFHRDPATLWASVLKRKGGSFAMLASMPYDPRTN